MTTSKEVIEYLKKNIEMENVEAAFTAGSLPETLIPQSDLDIYIVAKKDMEQRLLSNLHSIMDRFAKKHNTVTYSFYRGPIKYRYKGLIHFLIYSKEKIPGFPRSSFYEENKPVLKEISKSAKIIGGTHPRVLLKGFDLSEEDSNSATMKRWKYKYKNLVKNNRINHPEWKNTNGRWAFTRTYKRPSSFLREELIKYYKKNKLDK